MFVLYLTLGYILSIGLWAGRRRTRRSRWGGRRKRMSAPCRRRRPRRNECPGRPRSPAAGWPRSGPSRSGAGARRGTSSRPVQRRRPDHEEDVAGIGGRRAVGHRPRDGTVYDVQNIPSWKKVGLKAILEERYAAPPSSTTTPTRSPPARSISARSGPTTARRPHRRDRAGGRDHRQRRLYSGSIAARASLACSLPRPELRGLRQRPVLRARPRAKRPRAGRAAEARRRGSPQDLRRIRHHLGRRSRPSVTPSSGDHRPRRIGLQVPPVLPKRPPAGPSSPTLTPSPRALKIEFRRPRISPSSAPPRSTSTPPAASRETEKRRAVTNNA